MLGLKSIDVSKRGPRVTLEVLLIEQIDDFSNPSKSSTMHLGKTVMP